MEHTDLQSILYSQLNTYQYISVLMFITILLLAAIVIRKRYKIHALLEEINNLHRISKYLPDTPSSGYVHYDILKDSVFYSAAMRKIMQIDEDYQLNTIQHLREFFKPESMQLIESFFDNMLIDITWFNNFENSILETYDGRKYWINCQPTSNSFHQGFILWFFTADSLITTVQDYKDRSVSYAKDLESVLSLLTSINIPVWFRDKTLKVRYYNQYYKELVEAKNKTDFSLELAKNAKNSNQENSERMNFNIDGDRYIFDVKELAMPVNDMSIGYAIDITKSEQLKKEIKQHNIALSDFISSSSSGVALFSSDMRIQMWNFSYQKMWDLDEKFLSTNPTHPEIVDVLRKNKKLPDYLNFAEFKKNRIKLFKSLTTIHNEFLYLSEGRTVRVIVTPHALGGLIFTYEDMTDKLVLERSYNTLIAVQNATLNNVHEALCVIGSNGKIKLYNNTFAKLWGLTAEYLDSKPHINDLTKAMSFKFKHISDCEAFKSAFLTIYDRSSDISYRFEMADDTIIDRFLSSLPDGSVMISDLDITDSMQIQRTLREHNEALLQINKLRTKFLENISYSLRSPLTSIIGFSEMLIDGILGQITDQQKEYLNYIHTSSEDLKILIDDIIELAALDAGEIQLNKQDVKLSEIIDYSVHSLQLKNVANENNFIKVHKSNAHFYADEFKIKQALYNICGLVSKISPESTKIVTSFNDKDEIIDIDFVTNSAMQPEDFMKFFDRFSPVANEIVSTNEFKSINLTVAKKIIELHHGTISASISNDNNLVVKIQFCNS